MVCSSRMSIVARFKISLTLGERQNRTSVRLNGKHLEIWIQQSSCFIKNEAMKGALGDCSRDTESITKFSAPSPFSMSFDSHVASCGTAQLRLLGILHLQWQKKLSVRPDGELRAPRSSAYITCRRCSRHSTAQTTRQQSEGPSRNWKQRFQTEQWHQCGGEQRSGMFWHFDICILVFSIDNMQSRKKFFSEETPYKEAGFLGKCISILSHGYDLCQVGLGLKFRAKCSCPEWTPRVQQQLEAATPPSCDAVGAPGRIQALRLHPQRHCESSSAWRFPISSR